MLTYLPLKLNENNCVIYYSNDIIRVYDSLPVVGDTVTFTDYFITNHYTNISDTVNISETITCLDQNYFTNNVFYRYDISDIVVTFTCIFFISVFLIYFALKCFFRGFFK